MGRANNERQCCSSKAQHIFHSVVDIMQASIKLLILLSNPILSQILVLDTG